MAPIVGPGPQSGVAPYATHLTPPMLDGGTRFAFTFWPGHLPASSASILERLRVPRSRDDEKADRDAGGRTATFDLPGGRRTALVEGVTGERLQRIALHFLGAAYVLLDVEQGTGALELKSEGLWAAGSEAHLRAWLEDTLALVSGSHLDHIALEDHEFRCTRVELCVDAIGVDFDARDRAGFVGAPRKTAEYASGCTTETLAFGSRKGSAVSFVLYDKLTQIEQTKRCHADTYQSWWEAGARAAGISLQELLSAGAAVRRLEFRLRDRGLQFEDKATGEVLDLRDPLRVVDPHLLAQVYAHLTSKIRLVIPGSATRLDRCATDPRWAVFQGAADADPGSFVQRRESTTAAHAEAVERAARGVLKNVARLGALVDHEIVRPAGVGDIARYALARHAGSDVSEGSALREYATRYRRTRHEQLGAEIEGRGARDFLDFIEERGFGALGLRRFPPETSPDDTENPP